jgi:WD40 repeat protein
MNAHVSRFALRLLWAALLLVAGWSNVSPAPADEEDDPKTEAALKALAERVGGPSSDQARLRADLLAFRLAHPGRPAARAAGLLARLPSPLDHLDAKTIPALERFDWQPKELVGVIGEHRCRHGNPVTCVAFSADGTLAASGGGSYVRLWEPSTLRLVALLGASYVRCIAFSRDGKLLAAGGDYGHLTVWRLAKGAAPQACFSRQAASTILYSLAFSPDSKLLATACFDNNLRIYDVSGKEIKESATLNNHTKGATCVAFSPDGKTLASGSHDLTVRLWTVNGTDVKERAVLEGHVKELTALAFTPSGGTLASACNDGSIRLWNMGGVIKARPRLVLENKCGSIAALSFSATGNTLAGACSDGTIRLWNVGSGRPQERAKIEGHAGAVNGVAYAPDNRTLLSGSADWTVRSWDVTTAKPRDRFEPRSHLSQVNSLDFATDCQSLVSAGVDTIIRVWDLTRPELKTRSFLKGDGAVVNSVAYSPDGKAVAAGGIHTTVRQWDAQTGRPRPSLTGNPSYVYQLAYSSDGGRLLVRGQYFLSLWDAHKGQEIQRFNVGDKLVNCSALSPDGRHVLSGHGQYLVEDNKIAYKDGKPVYTNCIVRLFETEEGKEVYANKAFLLPIYSAGFSADGRQAFTGPYDVLLLRWDVGASGLTAAPPLKGDSGYVHALATSPDGKLLLTRGLDGQLVLWDLATGKRLRQWVIREEIGSMAFAPDSRHLAVGLATGVIYVLRVAPPSK